MIIKGTQAPTTKIPSSKGGSLNTQPIRMDENTISTAHYQGILSTGLPITAGVRRLGNPKASKQSREDLS